MGGLCGRDPSPGPDRLWRRIEGAPVATFSIMRSKLSTLYLVCLLLLVSHFVGEDWPHPLSARVAYGRRFGKRPSVVPEDVPVTFACLTTNHSVPEYKDYLCINI